MRIKKGTKSSSMISFSYIINFNTVKNATKKGKREIVVKKSLYF